MNYRISKRLVCVLFVLVALMPFATLRIELASPSSEAVATVASPSLESEPATNRTLRVSSISELQSRINSALPGDQIIVVNGVYSTAGSIKVAKQGIAARPIVISAETIGSVEINGTAGFDLESPASYVVIKGFKFTHSIGTVQVRAGASHCRLTRNVFELKGEERYLIVSGDDCEIDHNTFQNKSTVGPMFSIHGPGTSGMAQRTWVSFS
ncbi:MAG: hypothetical protein M3R52_12795 [Acidobacteriota bacterium]|nr:hypothetical protein [Acidobacteriota bacterium]